MCPTVELSLIELWLLHFPFKRERNQQSSLQSILSQGLSKDYIKSNGAKRWNKSPTSTPYNKKEVSSVTNSQNDKTYKTFPLLKLLLSIKKAATIRRNLFTYFHRLSMCEGLLLDLCHTHVVKTTVVVIEDEWRFWVSSKSEELACNYY